MLLQKDGELTPSEVELPFRYEFDGLPQAKSTATICESAPAFDGSIAVINCRARMDGERMGIDAELAVSLRTHAPAPFTALTDVGFNSEITHRRGEYVICFPAPSDTAWSVAKRYHAPIAGLTAANNLPAGVRIGSKDSLEGIKYLIV